MLAVTQFEVYVLDHGRWLLHARYPAADRQEAMWDARSTEASTGFPAKIVRETFFPELNDSERITTYISPKAKKPIKARPVETPQQVRQPKARARKAVYARPRLSGPQVILRILVAAAFSLIAAAIMAVVVNWILSRFAGLGIELSSSTVSVIVTYSWVAMFLLFFFSLFRSRLPLHRLLADMWQAGKVMQAQATLAQTKAAPAGRMKPKYDRKMAPETLAEWRELRKLRGDPDPFSEAEAADAPASLDGAAPQSVDAAKPAAVARPEDAARLAAEKTLDELIAQENAVQEKAAKAAREKRAQEKAAKEKAAGEKAGGEKAGEEKAETKAETKPDGKAAEKTAEPKAAEFSPAPVPFAPADEKDFAHTELRRFVAAVVKPAAASAMRDDPVARRGIALAITGAVDALAARPETRGLDAGALLNWGLGVAGLSEGVAAFFVADLSHHRLAPNNHLIITIGEDVMTAMIVHQNPDLAALSARLASVLAAWRTPFGLPGLLPTEPVSQAPAIETLGETLADGAAPFDAAPPLLTPALLEVFLLTELRPPARGDDPALDDSRMAAHNDRVRVVLNSAGATELKHTGKGIFARFSDPAAAIASAQELQRDLGTGIALALIGNTDANEDPVLSPALFLRAEAAMAVTSDGLVTAEAHVTGESLAAGQSPRLVSLDPPAPVPAGEPMVA